eukprot:43158_1
MSFDNLSQLYNNKTINKECYVWNGIDINEWTKIKDINILLNELEKRNDTNHIEHEQKQITQSNKEDVDTEDYGAEMIDNVLDNAKNIYDAGYGQHAVEQAGFISRFLADKVIRDGYEDDEEWFIWNPQNRKKLGPFGFDVIFQYFKSKQITENSYLMDEVNIQEWTQLKHIHDLYQRLINMAKEMENEEHELSVEKIKHKRQYESLVVRNDNENKYENAPIALKELKKRTEPLKKLLRECGDCDSQLLDELERLIGMGRLSQIESKKQFKFIHSPKNKRTYNF